MSPHRGILLDCIRARGRWPEESNQLVTAPCSADDSAPPFSLAEPSRLARALGLSSVFGVGVLTLAASNTPTGTTSTIPIDPECTIHVVDFAVNPQTDVALVSDRPGPLTNAGFSKFRPLGGPIGNSAIGFTPDVYGFNEAWLANSSVVFRAQSHPMRRTQFNDNQASAWSVTAEDASGTWSAPFAAATANAGQEADDPAAGGITTPQLMPVGNANPEMFACAGVRSDDGAIRTTSLFEFMAPSPLRPPGRPRPPAKAVPIQDLLSGDDHFQTTISGPLNGTGRIDPPTPRITGPGNPITQGAIQCAMLQSGDDVTTRELHMLALDRGKLYHAMATNWSTATEDNGKGSPFMRFNTVSQWSDVGQRLGGVYPNIVAAAIVASRPNAVSVLFAAETPNGSFKLIHAVRISPTGMWRNPDDVLAMNGGTSQGPMSGYGKSFQVAAGMCPAYQPPAPTQDQDLVYVLWTADRDLFVGRFVANARQWSPQLTGNYSPWFDISELLSGTSDLSRMDTINSASVSTRPFRDPAPPQP